MERSYQIHGKENCKKNIVLLFRSKPYLTNLTMPLSYIHTYIFYANIAWGATYISNLKKINSQQKHAIRILYNKKEFETVRNC